MRSEPIEKLRRDHRVDAFDCGVAELNQFLVRHALQTQQSNAGQTYVAVEDGTIIGYYTLVVGQVNFADAPERLKKGLARHPVPVMTLARLAVGAGQQGKGIGAALLKDAMLRTLQAADIAGIRAMEVHAKNDNARAFYAHFDFEPSHADPLHLFVLCKEIRQLMR